MANKQVKRVAIVGSARIPFCRAYSGYMHETNLSMMSGALGGLVEKYGLKGQHVDEVMGGVVLNHSRDFNIAREAALNGWPCANNTRYNGANRMWYIAASCAGDWRENRQW